MGTTSDKLTYLNGTKSTLKDMINLTGVGITSETTFRNYAAKLYDGYVEVLKDKYTLLDAMPKGIATGTNVTISDAVDLPVYNLQMDKVSSQETTTGKNLVPNTAISETINGVTFTKNSDGTIIANGTATAAIYYVLNSNVNLNDGTYTLSGCPKGGNTTSTYYLRLVKLGISSYLVDTGDSHTKEISNVEGANYSIYVFNGATLNNLVFKPMIRLASVTDGTYEPYTNGPSPNPDYPQEVKTVKGYEKDGNNYVDIKVTGKNLFDKSDIVENKMVTGTGSLLDFSGVFSSNFIKVLPNTTYYVNEYIPTIVAFDKNKDSLGYVRNAAGATSFTTPNNCEYVRVRMFNADISMQTAIENAQLERNSISTTYEAYKETIVPIPLNNNEIAGIGDYLDELIIDKTGRLYLNKKIRKVELDGSENGWSKQTEGYMLPINNISNNTKELYSNLFKNYQTYNELINQIYGIGKIYPNVQQIYVRNSNITTLAEWKTWLSTHNTDVYYVLATPELIDLNTTIDVTLFEGINNISNSEDANMQIRYVKNNEL